MARWHEAAIDALALVGEPFNDLSRGHGFALGLGQGLALFLGQQRTDFSGTFAHQRSRPAHGLCALDGRHVAPNFEALLRSRQRAVQVGDAGVGDAPNFDARGRVVDGEGASVGGVLPLTVNVELRIGITHRTPL